MSSIDIDQPGNLAVVNGSQIVWDGSTCVGSAITYRIDVTRNDDGESEGDITITSETTAIVSNLQPNQEYTVSVTAVGSSCASDSATKNFTSQAGGCISTTSKSLFSSCLLYTSPSPRDATLSRMPSSA